MSEKYKNVTIKGSTYPDEAINNEQRITFSKEMINEYIPCIEKMGLPKGLKLLCVIMAHKEGYYKGTRSYRTNNPGNIGNTDSGSNSKLPNLQSGINAQVKYITRIINAQHPAYPMNKRVLIKPFYSKEIAENQKTYGGKSPYLAGYDFKFTGQLDQFVKIYSTGARNGNGYLSMIISFFKNHGIELMPESKLQDIVKL
jgi:hypothetical protein